jgi:glycosyltransferase involved in cell wall biosynthesis
VDGVSKIVQNTGAGWLCPRNDAHALMAAMEVAITSTDRGERAERSRRLVAERYSAERMAGDYEQLYQELLQ